MRKYLTSLHPFQKNILNRPDRGGFKVIGKRGNGNKIDEAFKELDFGDERRQRILSEDSVG